MRLTLGLTLRQHNCIIFRYQPHHTTPLHTNSTCKARPSQFCAHCTAPLILLRRSLTLKARSRLAPQVVQPDRILRHQHASGRILHVLLRRAHRSTIWHTPSRLPRYATSRVIPHHLALSCVGGVVFFLYIFILWGGVGVPFFCFSSFFYFFKKTFYMFSF